MTAASNSTRTPSSGRSDLWRSAARTIFAGSDGGGDRWAILCLLIETCKLYDVEPYAYLRDVLQRMVDGHPINRLYELLPWAWNAQHPVKA